MKVQQTNRMRFLIDTLPFLWFVTGDARLRKPSHELLTSGKADLFVSAVSLLEIQYKASAGKVRLANDVNLVQEIANNRFMLLPLTGAHCEHLRKLADAPSDFFDKMLVAQADAENLTLLTHDSSLAANAVPVMLS